MDRNPPTHIDIDLDCDEDITAIDDPWFDERTVRIDFERPLLSCDEKLVFGYLTMEHHGAFAELSLEEQFQIVNRLRR